MKLNNRLMGRRIGAAAVSAAVISCGGLAWTSAALAAPTVASVTTQGATHSAAFTPGSAIPQNATTCQEWLQINGYTVSTVRATACHVAALGKPNMHAAIVACTAALVATKVRTVVAGTACAYGAIPG
jgi:hypothetical protein